jgi:hypothetical protein
MHSDAIHSRHRRTELDGNRLNPDYMCSICFGTMMDDYCKVSMAFKGRWSGSCSTSKWSIQNVFKWVKLRVDANFSRHQRTELDSCRFIPDNTDQTRFCTMMDEYYEVFGAFKCRGRAPVFELVGQNVPSGADFLTH